VQLYAWVAFMPRVIYTGARDSAAAVTDKPTPTTATMAPKKKTTAKNPAPVAKKAIAKKAPAKKVPAAKKTAPKKAPAKKATPAKKAAPTAKKASVKKAPAKAAEKKKPVKKEAIDVTAFTDALLDVAKLVTLACKTKVNDTETNLQAFKLVHTDDFSAASGVLQLLPEDARYPMMRLAQAYLEEMRRKGFEYDSDDDLDLTDSSDDELEESEEEDAEDAERTAAILDEYARELDNDDDGQFLFGSVMEEHHFVQFKQVFTVKEAKELIASHKEGGKLDKAMEGVVEALISPDVAAVIVTEYAGRVLQR
jgi:hypothetical protein